MDPSHFGTKPDRVTRIRRYGQTPDPTPFSFFHNSLLEVTKTHNVLNVNNNIFVHCAKVYFAR